MERVSGFGKLISSFGELWLADLLQLNPATLHAQEKYLASDDFFFKNVPEKLTEISGKGARMVVEYLCLPHSKPALNAEGIASEYRHNIALPYFYLGCVSACDYCIQRLRANPAQGGH